MWGVIGMAVLARRGRAGHDQGRQSRLHYVLNFPSKPQLHQRMHDVSTCACVNGHDALVADQFSTLIASRFVFVSLTSGFLNLLFILDSVLSGL